MVSELAFLGSDMEFLIAEQVGYSTGNYGVHLPRPFQVSDYLLAHSYEYSPPSAPPDQFLLQSSLQARSNPNPYMNYFCSNPSEYVPLPPLLNQYFNDLHSQAEIPPYVHPPDGSNYPQPYNSSFSNDCLEQPYKQSTNLHTPTTPPVQPPYYYPCSISPLPINQPLEIQYCNPHISPPVYEAFEDSTIENYGGEANFVENYLTETESSVSVHNCIETMVEHDVFDNSPEIENYSCEVNFAENYLSVVDMADTVISVLENPSFWSSNELVNGSVEVVTGEGSFWKELEERNVMENEDFESRVEAAYTEGSDQQKNNEDDFIDGGSRIGEIELMRGDLKGKEMTEGTNQESISRIAYGFSNSTHQMRSNSHVMDKVFDSSSEGVNEEYDAETDILDYLSRSCANASKNCGKIDECNLNEFFYMRQTSTVRNFFNDLVGLIPMVNTYCEGLTEGMVVDIFIGGLRQDIRNSFGGCYPSSMLGTLELAELEEKNIEALRGENSMGNGIRKHVESVDNEKVRAQILRSTEGVEVIHKGDVATDTINAELIGKGVDVIGEIEENEPAIRDYNLENFNASIIESSKSVNGDNDENEDLEVTNMETLKGLTCNDESDISEGSGIIEVQLDEENTLTDSLEVNEIFAGCETGEVETTTTEFTPRVHNCKLEQKLHTCKTITVSTDDCCASVELELDEMLLGTVRLADNLNNNDVIEVLNLVTGAELISEFEVLDEVTNAGEAKCEDVTCTTLIYDKNDDDEEELFKHFLSCLMEWRAVQNPHGRNATENTLVAVMDRKESVIVSEILSLKNEPDQLTNGYCEVEMADNSNFILKPCEIVGVNLLMFWYRKRIAGSTMAIETDLGRTIQVTMHLTLLKYPACNPDPHLIVCSASVIETWKIKLKKWCPSFNVLQYRGTARAHYQRELSSLVRDGLSTLFTVILVCCLLFGRHSTQQKDDRKILKWRRCNCVLMDKVYTYGFEKPSAIQQGGIVTSFEDLDVFQQARYITGKTSIFCSGILQQLDNNITECQDLVFDACHLHNGDKIGGSKDSRVGEVKICILTLETDGIYTHSSSLLILSTTCVKNENQMAVRFKYSLLMMMHMYSPPLLPKIHYINLLFVTRLDSLRHRVTPNLSLRKEVLEYVIDVGSHKWITRRSTTKYCRIMGFWGNLIVRNWFGQICNWRNSITTVLIHIFVILLLHLKLVSINHLQYFLVGVWCYMGRPRHIHRMDVYLSCDDNEHPYENDYEFDTFQISYHGDLIRVEHDLIEVLTSLDVNRAKPNLQGRNKLQYAYYDLIAVGGRNLIKKGNQWGTESKGEVIWKLCEKVDLKILKSDPWGQGSFEGEEFVMIMELKSRFIIEFNWSGQLRFGRAMERCRSVYSDSYMSGWATRVLG